MEDQLDAHGNTLVSFYICIVYMYSIYVEYHTFIFDRGHFISPF